MKDPRFTLLAILTLALGIGSTTAIFSVVHTVLLRPLPYRDPARLVVLLGRSTRGPETYPAAPGNYLDWKQQSHVFASMSATYGWSADLTGLGAPEQIGGLRVTGELFSTLGVEPLLGRAFTPDDGLPGKDHVVILSYGLWQRRFGADPAILGQTLKLNAESYTVVGVMPRSFAFPLFWATNAQMWAPVSFPSGASRSAGFVRAFARLKPEVSLAQARSEMDTVARRLEADYPEANTSSGVAVVGMYDMVVGKVRQALVVMTAAVGFLLLIACANVANLLLTRGAVRQREMALRLALGAGRARLVRQLLAESVLLGVLAGAAGLLVALAGLAALDAAIPDAVRDILPRGREISIDGAVLAFTVLASLATSVLCGLAPALASSRVDLQRTLKEGGRHTGSSGRNSLRHALAIAEIALALMLLAGAGLMLRSFARLTAIDPGFTARNVLTLDVSTRTPAYKDPARLPAFYRQLAERISALPGVEGVGAINHLPLSGDAWSNSVSIEGRPEAIPSRMPHALIRVILPGYIAAMRIRLLEGRGFDDRDGEKGVRVAIVNETMARRFWPHESAIGKHVKWSEGSEWLTVIGVIQDVRQFDWSSPTQNEMMQPLAQSPKWSSMTLTIRAAEDPMTLAGAVEREVWAMDRDLPVSHVSRMEQVVSNAVWQPRFWMVLLGIFAAVALVLAAVGVYGVMSYAMSRRTHEIGIRMALGARPGAVLALVLRQGVALAAAGIALGTGGALVLTRLMESLLYQVTPADPLTFVGVAMLLAWAALTACYVPARRAARVDPVVALRYD